MARQASPAWFASGAPRSSELVRLGRADGEPIAQLTDYLPEQVVDLDETDLTEHGL